MIAACVTIFCRSATGQTEASSKPQPVPTHAELYARIAQNPIQKVELRSPTGDPLTDAQRAELKTAEQSHEKAETLLNAGNYQDAMAEAVKAAKLRTTILGNVHHLTVSSIALADTAQRAAALPSEDKAKFAEARKALADWSDLNKAGRYDAALEKAQLALDYAKSQLTDRHPMTALAYLRVGTTQIDLGDYNKAEANIKQAQALTKTLFGENHPRYADVMDRLGWVGVYLAGQGVFSKERAESAVESLQTAVQIYRTTVGETADTAESLDNLGTALAYVQRIPEALDSKLRALFIRETLLGADSRDTAVSLSNLAWLYGRIGLPGEVLPMRERALEIFKKLLRPDHPYIYLESANVGWDYHLAGRDDEAIRIFEGLVEQDKHRKDQVRPDVVQRLTRLAEINAAAHRYDTARTGMAQAVEAIRKLYDGGYPAQALNSLAGLARSASRARMYDAGAEYYRLACAWAAEPKSEASPADRGTYEMSYGSVLLELGQLKEAKSALTDAVKRLEADGEDNQGRLVEPLIYLSRVETELGDAQSAIKHADRAVQIVETRYAERGFATAFPQLWLGRAYLHAGNTAMAHFCMNDAKTTFDKLDDRDPTGGIMVRLELADAFTKESKPDAAIRELNEALEMCKDVQKRVENAHLDAMTARVLRSLLDATKSGGPREQREQWKREAVSLLKKLESNQLLNAEEKAWLKANP